MTTSLTCDVSTAPSPTARGGTMSQPPERHSRKSPSLRRRVIGFGLGLTLIGGPTAVGAGAAPADAESANVPVDSAASVMQHDPSTLAPVDPEDWVHQEDTTWDDYEPV